MWEEDGKKTWVDLFMTRMGRKEYLVSFTLTCFKCHFDQRLNETNMYVICIWWIIVKLFVWVLPLVTFIYLICFKDYFTNEPVCTL
jgi:hypothetical protein